MEKLRLFAVAGVTTPPVELSRKREKQLFTCSLTLPLPPQLLVFSQGQWPPGDKSDVTLDIFLDSQHIGVMHEYTKCFAWDTDSLDGRPAGEKVTVEVKVVGMKVPPDQTQITKGKKAAAMKKTGKASPTQSQKETAQDKEKPLSDISEKINVGLEKMTVDADNKQSPSVSERPRGEKTAQDTSNKRPHVGFEKGKPGRKKNASPALAVAEGKKTRQTQLSFAGFKKVSPVAAVSKKQSEEEENMRRPVSDMVVAANDVDEVEMDEPDQNKVHLQTRTELMELEDERCEAQVLNESTPQLADMPSPLPRKPAKQKRLRSENADKTPEGPTPKKRGTRMRALISEGSTPKNLRTKTALGDSTFAENVIARAENVKAASQSEGRLTRCTDLSARAPRPSARWGHSMLLAQPRCAVVIGGQGDRQQLSRDSVWTLHTETRKWQCQEIQSEGQKPENRMGHTANYDPTMRCIYIFGGSKNSRWFHDVHVYDMDESKWTLAKVNGKAPTRAYHTSTLHRHELWIFGGVYPRPDPNPDGCSNDIHIFSPIMQSWYSPLVQGEKPLPRSGHSATLINDQLVMFGGWDAPFCYNDLFILDMTTVDWSKPDVKGTPPKPRSWHASCALSNQRILIHGGYDGNNALEDSFIFDIGALSWSQLVVPNAPKARAGHAAVCLPYSHENQEEDEVLVFGGGDNDGGFFHDLLSFSVPFNAVVEVD